jgi:hypothetical protein
MIKALVLVAALVVVPTLSLAQTWNLVVFDPREGKPWPATLVLKESGGAATVETVRAGVNDPCMRATKASVERSAATITITNQPLMSGCAHLRYIIKADGTGGKVQRRADANAEWADDPRGDRGLTLVKSAAW